MYEDSLHSLTFTVALKPRGVGIWRNSGAHSSFNLKCIGRSLALLHCTVHHQVRRWDGQEVSSATWLLLSTSRVVRKIVKFDVWGFGKHLGTSFRARASKFAVVPSKFMPLFCTVKVPR